MTDLDKLKELLDSFGVVYDTYKCKNVDGTESSMIFCEEGHSGVADLFGYKVRYKTDFEFDHEGTFVRAGIWT